MRSLARGLAAAALAVTTATALTPSPASAATISSGHLDILDVDLVGTSLTLDIRTETPSVNDDLSPAGTVLAVPPAALSTVPSGSGYSCLGTTGSSVYLLPQAQNASLLWPGWNTVDVPSSGPSSITLTLDTAASTLPSGARFAIYTTSLGTPTFRFNTNSASGCPKTSYSIPRNTHGHAFWAFTKAGTYT